MARGPMISIGCLMLAAAGATAAENAAPDRADGRYSIAPVEGGIMRVDKETGAVTHCGQTSGAWTCTPVDGSSKSNDERLERLETENAALKERLAALQKSIENGDAAPAGPPLETPPGGVSKLPSEKDIDTAFDYVEGMVKKLRERIEKLEPKTAPPATPAPL